METDMCGSESRKELPLASSSSGCSCCSAQAPEESLGTAGAAEYVLEGLTCGHCVETVRKAVTAVGGVEAASVELVAGGRSRLVVSGSAADAAVRDAVTSAGYSLVPR
jgi:copper chaperone